MDSFIPSTFFYLSKFKHKDLFMGCQNVWEVLPRIASYLKAIKLGKIDVEIPPGAFLVDPELIVIEEGVTIEPGCYIKGPCFIGAHSTVRHGAYIRGDVIVGQNSVVGHDSEVKNSILLDFCHAAHFAYVGDSILGNHVNLGAGTKCANLRLDNKNVILLEGQTKIETGLRKFGAVIGDGSQLGCNTVTNQGTILGKNVFCYPCTRLGGIIPANSTVRSDTSLIISSNKERGR